MEFLCYHRDRPGSMALRRELSETHWSYLDGYAARVVGRHEPAWRPARHRSKAVVSVLVITGKTLE